VPRCAEEIEIRRVHVTSSAGDRSRRAKGSVGMAGAGRPCCNLNDLSVAETAC
jgi:hypothetical protein